MNPANNPHWYDLKCSELTDIRIAIRTLRENHALVGLSEDEFFKMLKRLNEKEAQLRSELDVVFNSLSSQVVLKDLFDVLLSETVEAQGLMKHGKLFSEENQRFLESYIQRLLRMHLYLSKKEQDATDPATEQCMELQQKA
jgi:hypothetical protein